METPNVPARLETLRKSDLDQDPVAQFRRWFAEAKRVLGEDATAMMLATADSDGSPSGRIVLLKGFDDDGFMFFTNYNSKKSKDLEANPRATLVFWWLQFAQQIRISGEVARLSAAASDAYFQSRPRGSQLGAWASPQSEVIDGRAVLEERLASVKERFGDGPVQRPPFWGGYRVIPDEFEFWLGGSDRLHDRFRYTRKGQDWQLDRLGP